MTKHITLSKLLLMTSALYAPAALAQISGSSATASPLPPAASTPPGTDVGTVPAAGGTEEPVEISTPGSESGDEIVVVGRNIPQPIRETPQVVNVLSAADIARTGEGDIAGALQRVSGLTVVGSGFVYVRGLGDRYSLALLNGSPLPSPEPLRRVIPLDIFPTSVIASAVVQKSYSANYPGEFGGGVINLTTPAIPKEPFLHIGASVSGDTETTGRLGYTYYGSRTDIFGYDNGERSIPSGLRDAINSGNQIIAGPNFTAEQLQGFAASLSNSRTSLLQRNENIPANFATDISVGKSFDVGASRIGIIATAGYNNSWRTRSALQQTSNDPGLADIPQQSFRAVLTDNRVVLNGLLGLGAEFDEHKIKWTNLYLHDTIKQSRLAAGFDRSVADQQPGQPDSLIRQSTRFFERQLIDTQAVGEFRFGDLGLDLRGGYANSRRIAPYERDFSYFYLGDGNPATKGDGDIDDYINNLTTGGQNAYISFSSLNENVYSASGDLSYRLPLGRPVTLSAGYSYTHTTRQSSRYTFQFFKPTGALSVDVAQQRPDYLLSDFNIYSYGIQLRDVSTLEGNAPVYDASLLVHAAYGQAEAELLDGLRMSAGVRYETALQRVDAIGTPPTRLDRNYWLPALTVTWNFAEDMQLRLHGSKTIARPQFRELARQLYQDYESDRQFTGNPFITDSQLYNAEARYEWYYARDQRVTLAGFFKRIDNPIETVAFIGGGGILRTGFANAPKADLYGAEFEIQKYVPLEGLGGSWFSSKRLVLIGNYTYSKSKLRVDNSSVIGPDLSLVGASALFRRGAPLTGQSDHVANVQIGFEDTDKLVQATVLLNYASNRVTNRGPIQGGLRQPDIEERPGLRLDFVARAGGEFLGREIELKAEVRNITGTDYQEYQHSGTNRVDVNSYKVGTSLSLGAVIKF